MVVGWLMLTRLELLGSDDAAGDAVGVEIVLVRVVVVVEAPGDHGERWNYCRIADADVVRSGETGRGGGGVLAATAVLVLVW